MGHFFFYEKIIKPELKKFFELQNKISGKVFDGFSNFTSIIILGIQKTVSKNISSWVWSPKKLMYKIAKLNGARDAFSFTGTGMFVYLFFGLYVYLLYISGGFIEAGSLCYSIFISRKNTNLF